ncbi:SecDF P1 head subdomain-containing protein [Psychromarinibacter halotolerans]|nr:hypothetical protein [Psychromarinibacter halotolerans]
MIFLRKFALSSLTAVLLSGPAWAECSDAALALVIGDTSWPVTITSAKALTDPETDRAGVSMVFDARSARTMGQVTTDRVGETMAIENEGRLVLEAVIHAPVLDGHVDIRGFDNDRASEIVESLCGK